MKHTKGKWEIQELEKGKNGFVGWNTYCVRASKTNVHIATVGNVDRYYENQAEANARLIVAAPDLLNACKEAYELIRVARRHFPKSIKNNDTFQLENTNASIGKAIHKAQGKV